MKADTVVHLQSASQPSPQLNFPARNYSRFKCRHFDAANNNNFWFTPPAITIIVPDSFPRGSTLRNYSLGHESQAQPSIRNETTPSKEIQRNFFFSMMVFSIPHDLEKSRKNKIWSNFYRHTKTSGNLYFAQKNFLFVLFCSSGLPLARTRWVRSSFSSFCPLSFNQHR